MTQAETILEQKRRENIEKASREDARRFALVRTFKPQPRRRRDTDGAHLVVKMAVKQETRGGILLPENAKEIPAQGVVVVVGDGCAYLPGDQVLFSKFVGASVELPDGTVDHSYRILSEDECYGSWDEVAVAECNAAHGEGADAQAASGIATDVDPAALAAEGT